MKLINFYKSPNFDERTAKNKINYLILHYTAMRTYQEAIEYICKKENKVSSHFLITKNGKIYNLVDVEKRAWHAGLSYWKGLTDLNSNSIGIEIDNSGHHLDNEDYCDLQIQTLCELIEKLVKDFNINYHNILGHSDIAPFRKIDPGEKFPWHKLISKKLSYSPFVLKNNNKINGQKLGFFDNKKEEILYMFKTIGYDTRGSNIQNNQFNQLVKAYQRHYRQSKISGEMDKETNNLIIQHCKDLLTLD